MLLFFFFFFFFNVYIYIYIHTYIYINIHINYIFVHELSVEIITSLSEHLTRVLMEQDSLSSSLNLTNTDSSAVENELNISTRSDFEIQTQEDLQIMANRIDGLMTVLRELQASIVILQEARDKPTGCGFSCSNNSFAL